MDKGMFGFWRMCEQGSQASVASQVLKQASNSVRFLGLFGYFLVRVLAYVRVLSCSGCLSFARTQSRFGSQKASFWLHSACSGCSGISVENLCKRVWESLWGKSGKSCGKVDSAKSLVEKVWQKQVLHGMVEKFYHGFSTQVFPCKIWVLHNFHRAYYYDYYFLYRGKEI